MANIIRVQMWGPNFIGSAIYAAKEVIMGHLTRLDIYAGDGSPALPTLLPALYTLAPYFHPTVMVVLYVDRSSVSDSTRDSFAKAAGRPLVWAGYSNPPGIDGQKVWISEDRKLEHSQQIQDVTNNKSITANKAADRADYYIRS